MKNAVVDEAQAGIKIARRNVNNIRYADDPMAESKEKKEPSDEGEKRRMKKLA